MDSVCWQRRTAGLGKKKKQRDILIFKLLHHAFHIPFYPPDKRWICFIQYVLINLQFLAFDGSYQNRNPLRRSPTTVKTQASHTGTESRAQGLFRGDPGWVFFVFFPCDVMMMWW